jgi:hypothetical protein
VRIGMENPINQDLLQVGLEQLFCKRGTIQVKLGSGESLVILTPSMTSIVRSLLVV